MAAAWRIRLGTNDRIHAAVIEHRGVHPVTTIVPTVHPEHQQRADQQHTDAEHAHERDAEECHCDHDQPSPNHQKRWDAPSSRF